MSKKVDTLEKQLDLSQRNVKQLRDKLYSEIGKAKKIEEKLLQRLYNRKSSIEQRFSQMQDAIEKLCSKVALLDGELKQVKNKKRARDECEPPKQEIDEEDDAINDELEAQRCNNSSSGSSNGSSRNDDVQIVRSMLMSVQHNIHVTSGKRKTRLPTWMRELEFDCNPAWK